MRALTRKLVRDLTQLKGQAAAIATVIGSGVMVLIITMSSLDAVRLAQQRFYESHQFADVFADLVRAPDGLAERLREIPGVNLLETRVRAPVRVEVDGFDEPVRGLITSLPDGRQPLLNRLHIRQGSLPDPGRADQVLVSESFAEAHGLRAGDQIRAIINGRLETLTISGSALSPEHIYQIGPGDIMPDYQRFAVMWMNRRALGHAFAMDGAFNNVVLTLQAGSPEEPVIDALDHILARFGSVGAYGRGEQISHRFVEEELDQLRMMARVLPAIFLGVAAFLLNVLMARVLRTQRQQVAVLKAFGYRNRQIALHFGQFTATIVGIGVAAGVLLGVWAGDGLAGVYAEYFRFPDLTFVLRPSILLLAVTVSAAAAALGTWRAVRSAVQLPPAQAMRPPAPERFSRGWLEQSIFTRALGQPTRIILRNLNRHRFKTSLSVLGVGLSASLLLVGSYQFNAVDHMLDTQYRLVQRSDLHLTFTDPTPERVLAELRHAPGAEFVEGYRSVPVRLRHGHGSYRTSILGLDAEPQLRGLKGRDDQELRLPPEGLLLTDYLAAHLGVAPGDSLEVEVMEGRRQSLQVQVAGLVEDPVGVSAYMERRALNRLLREGPAISGVWMLSDRSMDQQLFEHLWEIPRLASIGLLADAEGNIRAYIQDTILLTMLIMLLLAGSIAFAVVYNNARITFAERARELATLRVLGFSRAEVAWILIGETFLITLLAIPVGWMIGTLLAWLLTEALSTDLFRIPFIITLRTYAFAAVGVLLAAVLTTLMIARRLGRLDMVSALKTAE